LGFWCSLGFWHTSLYHHLLPLVHTHGPFDSFALLAFPWRSCLLLHYCYHLPLFRLFSWLVILFCRAFFFVSSLLPHLLSCCVTFRHHHRRQYLSPALSLCFSFCYLRSSTLQPSRVDDSDNHCSPHYTINLSMYVIVSTFDTRMEGPPSQLLLLVLIQRIIFVWILDKLESL
jgi:hypothetical protein